jgi:outer membrane receptor protein involved in Fe transport
LKFGALSSAVAAALGSATPVFAQESAPEEVVVTGTRIVRRDLEANSPIMSVDAARFEESSTVAIESVLNQLPQFVPAASQFQSDGDGTGGYMSGARRTPGASVVSLRGLGSNRNLVLLDGRRAMPVNASMAVNVNNIPAAAIDRIETITGGASSVYGADAIAGVVNFVLKRDFEGLEFDVQTGETELHDAAETRVSALVGANLANGRGNVMFGVEHSNRGALIGRDRDFYNEGFADPSVIGTGRLLSSGVVIAAGNPASQAVVNQIFAGIPGVSRTGTFLMNDDGTLYKTAPAGSARYHGPFVDSDGTVWRKYGVDGTLIQNRAELTVQLPLNRSSIFGSAHFDISDNVTAYGQGLFTDTSSTAYGTFNAHVGGWGATVPHGTGIYAPSVDANGNTLAPYLPGGLYGLNCPATGGCTNSQAFPKPPEVNALLNSRTNPNDVATIYHNPVYQGQKSSRNDIESYQIIAGLQGKLAKVKDWTWDLHVSQGRATTATTLYGNSRLEGFRWLVNQPNYGHGLQYTGNELGSGFGAGTVYCTSGLPIFYGPPNGWVETYPYLQPTRGVPSADCLKTMDAIVKNSSTMRQNVAEFDLQGAAFNMPAGEMRFAVGTSYRENKYEYLPDALQTQSAIRDSIAGIYPVDPSFGEVSATDVYAELLVPLLAKKHLAEDVSLELGFRKSNNKPSEDVDTYKALVDWRFTDRIRFRGGRQRANRAPNVAELFQASEQQFLNSPRGDWCSRANPQNPLSPNPTLNPNAAQAEALCRGLMGPSAASVYYSETQNNATIQARWLNVIGNPTLHSEEANTTTAGLVMNVGDAATMSIDYWRIQISDMVSSEDVDALLNECFSPVINPTYDPNSPACSRIDRDPVDGGQAPYFVTFTNKAGVDAAGVDLQFNWAGTAGPGRISVNFMASILDHMKSQVSPTAPWREWKGSSGPSDLSGVQGFSYDYKTFTTTSYSVGSWTASLRWRFLPSIKSEALVVNPAGTQKDTGTYNIFDFSGRYDVSDRWSVRLGIDNLFNADPELTFPDATTSAKGSTNPGFYDVLGRRYYIGVNFAL